MDRKKDLIENYNDLLYEVYRTHQLNCLSDNECQYNGRNVLSAAQSALVDMVKAKMNIALNDVTDKFRKPRIQHMHAQHEIMSTTADLKYRLGTLYLYSPYIVKPSEAHYDFNGTRQHYLEPTRFDARFNREIPIAFEALYKFWQRLMDYVLSFFPDGLEKEKCVSYFHTPINYILANHKHLAASENFKWLQNFANNDYLNINKLRKRFVHAEGFEIEFSRRFLEADTTNLNAMLKLEKDRNDLLPFLKTQLDLCLVGYFKAMDFLDELVFDKDPLSGDYIYSLK